MGRWDEGLGVNSDDPDDLEIGCLVFSKTHTRSNDMPRGGTIIGISLDVDDSLLSVFTLEQKPGLLTTFEIDRCDIDMETVEWYGRNAATAATIINNWLSSKSAPRDNNIRLRWQRDALNLAEAATSGQWLPKADIRHRRHQSAKGMAS